ncbi:MAG: hypothetical protein DWQ02_06215 [Bacteroidetes bacterium]|nr:MAG: hypothetical protein DWQ02_06215 [Bacteroidota bacterium]
MFTRDKNTTIAGILAFLSLLFGQIQFMFDSDMTTNPDWSMIVSALFVLIGLIKAKDSIKEKTIDQRRQ